MERSTKPWIVCAANRHRESGLIVCGARYFDPIMRAQMKAMQGFPYWNNCEQGFIDQWGKFYTREEAYKLARANGQIRFGSIENEEDVLMSGHLY